jgi:hypothetical protein
VSEKLMIRVDAPKDHPDLMTVQDVFTHVLELFQLVGLSDPSSQSEVRWRLLSVNMNSPFTVTAEAIPMRPGSMPIDELARRQKTAFLQNYTELKAGRISTAWSGVKARDTAKRILARNRDGIGRTIVDVSVTPDEAPITITKEDADLAVCAVEKNAPQLQKTKEQIGSVEGTLVQIQLHYGNPAILILERKTQQEIWCVVPAEFQHQISESTSVEDVWKGSRVVVRGKITYATDGKISRVVATGVRRVQVVEVFESSIADRAFTGGLPISEYLERLRD